MLDVLGHIARTCWNGRNGLARSCKALSALSAPVDPDTFIVQTGSADLIESLLPNGVRHGRRVEFDRGMWGTYCQRGAWIVADYDRGMTHEMAIYTPRFDGLFISAADFMVSEYDGVLWIRRLEWVYRRVHFSFEDNGRPDCCSSSLTLKWGRGGRIDGAIISGGRMGIRASTPTNTTTVTIDEVIAWVESEGYVPEILDERDPSEFIDRAR